MLSSELVPGDVYEVSDPSLTQFPCDSLLLAGDCIVNESMLTGKHTTEARSERNTDTEKENLCQYRRYQPQTSLCIFWT